MKAAKKLVLLSVFFGIISILQIFLSHSGDAAFIAAVMCGCTSEILQALAKK